MLQPSTPRSSSWRAAILSLLLSTCIPTRVSAQAARIEARGLAEVPAAPRAAPWGWAMFVSPGSGQRNLCPTWDIGWHCLDFSCACGAVLDGTGMLVHNSYDGRERYEQGLAQRH